METIRQHKVLTALCLMLVLSACVFLGTTKPAEDTSATGQLILSPEEEAEILRYEQEIAEDVAALNERVADWPHETLGDNVVVTNPANGKHYIYNPQMCSGNAYALIEGHYFPEDYFTGAYGAQGTPTLMTTDGSLRVAGAKFVDQTYVDHLVATGLFPSGTTVRDFFRVVAIDDHVNTRPIAMPD